MGDEVFSVLDGLLFSNSVVRSAALEALFMVPALIGGIPIDEDRISAILLLACHDVDEHNKIRAQELFETSGNVIMEDHVERLSPLIGHETQDIRQATVGALVECLQHCPHMTQKLINYVTDTIKRKETQSKQFVKDVYF